MFFLNMNKAHPLFTDLWGQQWVWAVIGRRRCWIQQERGAVQHHKHSILGPGQPPCTGTWHSGHQQTPTHFHGGHRSSFKQQFFQIFAFIFLEGEGRQEEQYAFQHLKKNSIKPNFKMKELQKLQCRIVGNSQKPHVYYWTGLYRTSQTNTNPLDTPLP